MWREVESTHRQPRGIYHYADSIGLRFQQQLLGNPLVAQLRALLAPGPQVITALENYAAPYIQSDGPLTRVLSGAKVSILRINNCYNSLVSICDIFS